MYFLDKITLKYGGNKLIYVNYDLKFVYIASFESHVGISIKFAKLACFCSEFYRESTCIRGYKFQFFTIILIVSVCPHLHEYFTERVGVSEIMNKMSWIT